MSHVVIPKGAGAGEDLWLLSHFPDAYMGTAVELGAVDGITLSNTLGLEARGWTVLCIEPNPIHHEALKTNRKLVLTCACGSRYQQEAQLWGNSGVPGQTLAGLKQTGNMIPFASCEVRTLNDCLATSGFTRLDVLSLDVDGDELEILMAARIDEWLPRCAIIEENQDAAAIKAYMRELGYMFDGQLQQNMLFVRRS